VLLGGALIASGQGQRIERHELRGAADGQRLYVTIDGEDRLISSRALKAWPGWTPQTLIYSEMTAPGSETQRLRWYDAFTRNSSTISTDRLDYIDVATARLSTGEHAVLINLRDPQTHIPYMELAAPKRGVFLREQFAAYGTAANDYVEILRYAPEDVERVKDRLNLTTPTSVSRVPLTPGAAPNAAGLYTAILTPAAGPPRNITLNLRAGGQATLITEVEGQGAPAAVQGAWFQTGADVRLDLKGDLIVWTLSANGLTPKEWRREKWGSTGVPLRRQSSAENARP
jgi:hypothetical protein